MTPAEALADHRLQELALAIWASPLAQVRKRSDYPCLDQPLHVAILLIDGDTETQMQGLLGFLENSTGRYLHATVDALERVGATAAMTTLRSVEACMARHEVTWERLQADLTGSAEYQVDTFGRRHRDLREFTTEVAEVAGRFSMFEGPDGAHLPLVRWLATRLHHLDREVLAVGYRWAGSAGMDAMVCPMCGELGQVTVADHAVGFELRWSTSFRCETCGEAVEADDVGRMPEEFRARVIARSGLWAARTAAVTDAKTVASVLARGLGLRLDEALSRARAPNRQVVVGTRAEAQQAVAILRAGGVMSEVVRTEQ